MKTKKYTLALFFAALGFFVFVSACSTAATPLQIDMPENLYIKSGLLHWDGLKNVSWYEVEFNGEVVACSSTEYALPVIEEPGNYVFRVKAVASAGYLDSPWAQIGYTVETPTPGLSFYSLVDGSGYYVGSGTIGDDFSGRLVLPDYHNGLPVLGIVDGEHAGYGDTAKSRRTFQRCKNITSVRLPSTLKYIGDYAFVGTHIASITLPEGLEEIGAGSFNAMHNLAEINFPSSLKSIGEYAFAGCNFTSVVLPEGFMEMSAAFTACDVLESVVLPSTLTKIPDKAFNGCPALKSVTIGRSVTYIGEDAFYYGGGGGARWNDKFFYYASETQMEFTYLGTREEWGRIEIAEGWRNGRTMPYTVVCTDGTIYAQGDDLQFIPN